MLISLVYFGLLIDSSVVFCCYVVLKCVCRWCVIVSVIGVFVVNSVVCMLCWVVLLMWILMLVSVVVVVLGLFRLSMIVGGIVSLCVVSVVWNVVLCMCCELICLNGCMMKWIVLKLCLIRCVSVVLIVLVLLRLIRLVLKFLIVWLMSMVGMFVLCSGCSMFFLVFSVLMISFLMW